jgi:hypothetical protein
LAAALAAAVVRSRLVLAGSTMALWLSVRLAA